MRRPRRPRRSRAARPRAPAEARSAASIDAVRLVDLAVGRAARRAAAARCPVVTTATRGRAAQRGVGDARGGERREPRRRRASCPPAEHGSPARTSPPSGRTLAPGSTAIGHLDRCRPAPSTSSIGHDRVGALRHDAAGRDPHRLAALERPRGRPAGGDARDDRAARPACPPPRSAKPSIAELAERRQVDRRERVLGQHAAGCGIERHDLARKRPDPREHARERLLDGQQTGHGADGTHGVRSAA